MQKFKTLNETNMKKIISFCVWGNNPKYCIGAIKNAILAKQIYPDWICRYHCDKSVPKDIIEKNNSFFLKNKKALNAYVQYQAV